MGLGRPPEYPDLFDAIANMEVDTMIVFPFSDKSKTKLGKNRMRAAAYNYGLTQGMHTRAMTHGNKLYVIRVA